MRIIKNILLLFFLSLIFPVLPAQAADSFQLVSVQAVDQFDRGTQLSSSQNTSTSESIEKFEILLNEPCTIGSVTLQDGQGNDIPITQLHVAVYPPSDDLNFWYFTVSQPNNAHPLKWNTTYVLTVHGGPNAGWQDSAGDFLPTDQVYTFTTNGTPVINQYNFQVDHQSVYGVDDLHYYNKHYLMQTDVYPFHSMSGEVEFTLTAGINTEVMVRDTSGDLIYQHLLSDSNNLDDKIDIPQEGDYTLTIAGGLPVGRYVPDSGGPGYSLFLQGPHLQINNNFPQLYFQNENDYVTHNTPFSAGLEDAAGDPTSIDLLIDGKVVKTITDVRKPVLQATTVDPSQLPDGIHALTFLARTADVDVVSYTRFFLVDRHGAFDDVATSFWAAHEIDAMHALGIANGITPTQFNTQGKITRAEFATLLAKALRLPVDPAAVSTFSDVPSYAWYVPYVEAVAKAGYMVGVSSGGTLQFSPTQPITRADAATVIGRSLHTDGWQDCPYQDFKQVPVYAQRYVASLYYMAWMQGYPDGKFHPRNNMTRAEAVKLLAHALGM